MIKLLKIEWIKLSRRPSVWILFALFLLIIPVGIFIISNFTLTVNETDVEVSDVFDINALLIWQISAYVSSFLIWLPVVVLVSLISNDLNFRIMRQHVIEGLSRTEIVVSKVLLTVVIAFVCSLIMVITSAVFLFDFELSLLREDSVQILVTTGTYFMYIMGYLSFALLITLVLKSTGFTLILLLLWSWIAEPIIRYLDKSNVTDFLITNSFNDLIYNPILDAAGFGDFQMETAYAVTASLIWIGICLGLSFLKVLKSDL